MQELFNDLSSLLYPKRCIGCRNILQKYEHHVCLTCTVKHPHTHLFDHKGNELESAFKGRSEIEQAAALFYFSKQNISQKILHHIKYHKNKDLAYYFGTMLGHKIKNNSRFTSIQYTMPIPINTQSFKNRGFNQSVLLCEGIENVTGIPVLSTLKASEAKKQSQTIFNKSSRLLNIDQKFSLEQSTSIMNSHILLVDDVITTGSTIEGISSILKQQYDTKISVVSLAYTLTG